MPPEVNNQRIPAPLPNDEYASLSSRHFTRQETICALLQINLGVLKDMFDHVDSTLSKQFPTAHVDFRTLFKGVKGRKYKNYLIKSFLSHFPSVFSEQGDHLLQKRSELPPKWDTVRLDIAWQIIYATNSRRNRALESKYGVS